MNVVYVSSEVVPFAKTGGLADVAGALPRSLARMGHSVSVIMPFYKIIREGDFGIRSTDMSITVPMEGREETARIHKLPMGKNGVYYFVEHAGLFGETNGLYGTTEGDYSNNSERFSFFCKVIPEFLHRLGRPVDIVHCNDWQSALLPVYLKLWYAQSGILGGAASVLTVHNLAYQGLFPHSEMSRTGLPDALYRSEEGLEFYGKINFLKGGLLFADAITTVSRRYAEEIRTEEHGAGLEGVLSVRSDRLFGILNGIDRRIWNPETDEYLPSHFTKENLDGKKRCKRELQKECGLEVDLKTPLVGMITRLADQKGLDLVVAALQRLRKEKFQLVLLGTGDEKYHKILDRMGKKDPKRYSIHLKFDNAFAHRIEGGADIFLMPSRYEPCGLNQMYSLRYGTVPVVRATGGLADTVIDCTDDSLKDGSATGFRFDEYSAAALMKTLRRAFTLYTDRRKWLRLMRIGMSQDWSWKRSAAEYDKLYKQIRRVSDPSAG